MRISDWSSDVCSSDLPAQRARAQGDDQLGLDEGAFLVEPPAADVDLARRWVLVEAPFAARLELEMLDRVGEEQPPPVEPSLVQRLVQHLSRRPHERPPLQILLIARLLADKPDPRRLRPLPRPAPTRRAAGGEK